MARLNRPRKPSRLIEETTASAMHTSIASDDSESPLGSYSIGETEGKRKSALRRIGDEDGTKPWYFIHI